MSGKIDFYYMALSAPCRSVMMVAKQLGVDLNLKPTDLFKGETRTPVYLAMNPQHCIPTIMDGDFALWDSRVIMSYLVNKFAPGSDLYPSDPQTRAVVDRLLYFDLGTLYKTGADLFYPPLFHGREVNPEKAEPLREALKFLDGFVSKHKFAAADHLTIADISLAATASGYEALRYDISAYPNIVSWLGRVKAAIPSYDEVNKEPIEQFYNFVKDKLPAAWP